MSAYPLMIEGGALRALVVGGGLVAARKTRALLDSGASVRLIAPKVDPALEGSAGIGLDIERREYASGDIGDAMLVIAATGSREINGTVARDAHALGRLVNVVDAPSEGNCATAAIHRSGDLVIAVSAGGVPKAAARIRDCISGRFGEAYAAAITELSSIRSKLLESGQQARWTAIADGVIDGAFCDVVERGEFTARIARWR